MPPRSNLFEPCRPGTRDRTFPDHQRVSGQRSRRPRGTPADPRMLRDRCGGEREIHALRLGPLHRTTSDGLVADALHAEPAPPVQPLAELIFAKTGGNPFFTARVPQQLGGRRPAGIRSRDLLPLEMGSGAGSVPKASPTMSPDLMATKAWPPVRTPHCRVTPSSPSPASAASAKTSRHWGSFSGIYERRRSMPHSPHGDAPRG